MPNAKTKCQQGYMLECASTAEEYSYLITIFYLVVVFCQWVK